MTKYWEKKGKGHLKIYLMKEIVQFLILLYIWKWRMDFKRTLIIEIIDMFYNNNGQNKVYGHLYRRIITILKNTNSTSVKFYTVWYLNWVSNDHNQCWNNIHFMNKTRDMDKIILLDNFSFSWTSSF